MTGFDLDILEPRSSAMAISCSYCLVGIGEECVTPTATRQHPHHARWNDAMYLFRSREMWFVIREDDERFGLAAGDIVRCVNYPWDAKVSVLFREWDGFEPECNQYLRNVSFLGFVPYSMEVPLR